MNILFLNSLSKSKWGGGEKWMILAGNDLANRGHHVTTGVCIKDRHQVISFSDTTLVYFKTLTDKEIEYYIKNYEPFDKAGAYGI